MSCTLLHQWKSLFNSSAVTPVNKAYSSMACSIESENEWSASAAGVQGTGSPGTMSPRTDLPDIDINLQQFHLHHGDFLPNLHCKRFRALFFSHCPISSARSSCPMISWFSYGPFAALPKTPPLNSPFSCTSTTSVTVFHRGR